MTQGAVVLMGHLSIDVVGGEAGVAGVAWNRQPRACRRVWSGAAV